MRVAGPWRSNGIGVRQKIVNESVPAQYFIDLYRRDIDPWHFETSTYEREKYRATLDALPRERYERGLEIACSVGVFTNMLAPRCRELLAVDVSDDALARAAENCAAHAHVTFQRRQIPQQYPGSCFDLTMVCEVGFYLNARDLALLCADVEAHSFPGAHIVVVHWTPPVRGHASSTEEVHAAFRASPGLQWLAGASHDTYRLDVFERRRNAR